MPISVLEAMGARCLSVLSGIEPHLEIRAPKHSVRFVDGGNPIEVAKALRHFASLDADQREAARNEVREHVVTHFNLQLMLYKYLKVYDEMRPSSA